MRPTLLALALLVLSPLVGLAQGGGNELGVAQIRERIADESVSDGERASLVGLLFSRGRDGESVLRELLVRGGPGSEDARREVLIRAHVDLLPVVLAKQDDDAALRAAFYRFRTARLATSLATLVRDGERPEPARRRCAAAIAWMRSRPAIDALIALWKENGPGAHEAFDAVLPLGFENPDAAGAWWAARSDQPLERVLAEALRGSGEGERTRLERIAAEHREWAKAALPGLELDFVIDRGLKSVDAVVRGDAADVLVKRTQWTEAERTRAANGIARSIRDFPLDPDDPQSSAALISVFGAARLFTAELSAKDDRDALVQWIVEHVDDDETPDLRNAAIELVGFLGGSEGIPALKAVFADADPELKIRTLDALKRLGGPLGPWTEQALARELDGLRDESIKVVQKLVALLGGVGDVDSVAILDRVLRDSDDVLTRRFAAISIGQAGRLEGEARPLAPNAVEALLKRALIDAAPQVREQAARVLAGAPPSDAVRDAILAQLRVEKVSFVSGALAAALREVASDAVLPEIARAAGAVPEVARTLDLGVGAALDAKRYPVVVQTAGELHAIGNEALAGTYLRRVIESEGLSNDVAVAVLGLATPVAESLVAGSTEQLELADALALARFGAPDGVEEPFVARRLAVLMRVFVELGRTGDADGLVAAFPADPGDSRENVVAYRLEEVRHLASSGKLDVARSKLEALSSDGISAEMAARIETVRGELDDLPAASSARFERHLEEFLTRPRDERFRLLLPGVRQGGDAVKKRFRARLEEADLAPEATADLIARLRELFPSQAQAFDWAAADAETKGKAIGAWKTFLGS